MNIILHFNKILEESFNILLKYFMNLIIGIKYLTLIIILTLYKIKRKSNLL